MSILTTLKEAAGLQGESKRADTLEMDILDKLKQEHEEVGELLKRLVESKKSAERKSLLKQIKSALVPHLRAEEKVVYDAILAISDDKTKQNGEEGYMEHALGDKTLAALGKMENAMSPEFSAASKVLKELVEHHVKEEERNVWADVKEHFSSEERIEMNRRFEAAKKKVIVK